MRLDRSLTDERLTNRGSAGPFAAAARQRPCAAIEEQARSLEAHVHLRNAMTDPLKGSDPLAELNPGPRVLDVGSGAGLPGIVLAIANPALDIALLEPRAKRARFLTQVRIELGLEHVAIVRARVEAHSPVAPYDDIVTRALGSFAGFVSATRHLHAPGTRLTAMKARFDASEFDASTGAPNAAPAAAARVSVIPLTVPGYRDRCLVTLCPVPGESHEAPR